MAFTRTTRHVALLLITLALALTGRSAVAVTSTYTENFDSLDIALAEGWGVWTASTATTNGTAFNASSAPVSPTANNAAATADNLFRNLPGASQIWSAGLSSGTDRALGWRASSADSRDGSITFSWTNTAHWNFSSLSFDLFTPNSSGKEATFNLEFQIGAEGTFSQLAGKSYTTVSTPTAPAVLTVTSISLSALELSPLNNQSGSVTLRLNNLATTGTAFNTLAIDNFSYTATAIPEPVHYAILAGSGVLALALVPRLRRREA